jgi:predicted kinase
MFKTGQKVIVSSNDCNFKLGNFCCFENLDNCKTPIPMVTLYGNSEPLMCFGHVIPFSDEMFARLEKLTPSQQFDLLTAIKDWDGGKQFIIMRGIPGSGKSTKAKNLAGAQGQVFSADDYHVMIGNGKYDWRQENVGKAHDWNQKRSFAALNAGIPIVVIDNTNTTLREMKAYLPHIHRAMLLGYKVSIQEPDTSWAFNIDECFKRGTHNVPKATLQKMYDRYFLNADVEDVMFDL